MAATAIDVRRLRPRPPAETGMVTYPGESLGPGGFQQDQPPATAPTTVQDVERIGSASGAFVDQPQFTPQEIQSYTDDLKREAAHDLSPAEQQDLDTIRQGYAKQGAFPPVQFKWDDPVIESVAKKYNIGRGLLLGLMSQESSDKTFAQGGLGNPTAVSPTGVTGLMQVTQDTGAPYGLTALNRTNPWLNVEIGAHYLADKLAETKGNIPKALRRWNVDDPNFVTSVQRHAANWDSYLASLPSASVAGQPQPGGQTAAPSPAPGQPPPAGAGAPSGYPGVYAQGGAANPLGIGRSNIAGIPQHSDQPGAPATTTTPTADEMYPGNRVPGFQDFLQHWQARMGTWPSLGEASIARRMLDPFLNTQQAYNVMPALAQSFFALTGDKDVAGWAEFVARWAPVAAGVMRLGGAVSRTIGPIGRTGRANQAVTQTEGAVQTLRGEQLAHEAGRTAARTREAQQLERRAAQVVTDLNAARTRITDPAQLQQFDQLIQSAATAQDRAALGRIFRIAQQMTGAPVRSVDRYIAAYNRVGRAAAQGDITGAQIASDLQTAQEARATARQTQQALQRRPGPLRRLGRAGLWVGTRIGLPGGIALGVRKWLK